MWLMPPVKAAMFVLAVTCWWRLRWWRRPDTGYIVDGRCTSFWQTSKAPENRAFFLEPDPLQAIEQAEQAGKKQAAKWAAPQFEAIRIAPP